MEDSFWSQGASSPTNVPARRIEGPPELDPAADSVAAESLSMPRAAASAPPRPPTSPFEPFDPSKLFPSDPLDFAPASAPVPVTSSPFSSPFTQRAQPAPVFGNRMLKFSLASLLRDITSEDLGFDPGAVPSTVEVEISYDSILPQLATGRVEVGIDELRQGIVERFRPAFSRVRPDLRFVVPLSEVFQNLPNSSNSPPVKQHVSIGRINLNTPFPPTLSRRESEVLAVILEGRMLKEITTILGISQGTLNTHMRALYRKLQVKSRCEIMARYFSGNPINSGTARGGGESEALAEIFKESIPANPVGRGTRNITVNVREEEAEALKKVAEERGSSLSEILRSGIRHTLQKAKEVGDSTPKRDEVRAIIEAVLQKFLTDLATTGGVNRERIIGETVERMSVLLRTRELA
jgi:DNA-binding CsgD family transcriptional regulator